ncbi:MAG: DNA-deoxyinosine glycosylase [Pseudomonadota bacterium]
MSEDRAHGFAPLLGATPRVLLLGSLPSETSIARGEYYGHARNAFWPIVAALLDFDADAPYAERVAAVTAAGLAVWDVLAAARRPGSLDAAIETATEQANDIAALFRRQPTLGSVLLNGGKAETLFLRHVVRKQGLDVPRRRLPSTSPAHAAMRFAEKLTHWRDAFAAAGLLSRAETRE